MQEGIQRVVFPRSHASGFSLKSESLSGSGQNYLKKPIDLAKIAGPPENGRIAIPISSGCCRTGRNKLVPFVKPKPGVQFPPQQEEIDASLEELRPD